MLALSSILLVLGIIALPGVAHANLGEAFGFGSRSAALAGANVASGYDGFAAYLNPAGVADLPGNKRIALSVGLTYNQPSFLEISDVVTGNHYTKSVAETRGGVDTDYKATFGTVLGASFKLLPEHWNASFGLTAFLPIEQLAFLDTGKVYEPEYVLYRARTQRPQFFLAGAIEPASGLRVGAGLQAAFKVTSSADLILSGTGQDTSTMRLSATLKPFFVPYFGIQYSARPEEETGSTGLGLTLRLPAEARSELSLGANVDVSPGAFTFSSQAVSILYYDPWSLETGASYRYAPWGRAYAQLDFQAWQLYKQPAMELRDLSASFLFNSTRLPPADTRNILIPRVGQEIRIGRATWRLGYSYRQSIFRGPPEGAGNLLDPSRHILTFGGGLAFRRFLGFETSWSLDFHATYHRLVTQQITKSPDDEIGNPAEAKVGSPGYPAGGHVWGGGLSLSLSI